MREERVYRDVIEDTLDVAEAKKDLEDKQYTKDTEDTKNIEDTENKRRFIGEIRNVPRTQRTHENLVKSGQMEFCLAASP